MDNYQFYLLTRVGFLSPLDRTFLLSCSYSLGASVGPKDGDLDGCTSSDDDSDDIIISFHTFLVYGLDFGGVGSSFIGSSSSSFLGS